MRMVQVSSRRWLNPERITQIITSQQKTELKDGRTAEYQECVVYFGDNKSSAVVQISIDELLQKLSEGDR